MDAKDLKTESALDERNNDGSKYARNVAAVHCNRNKSYQDIGSNPLAKVDTQATRPCAVIGPDRVVPPPVSNDAYLKKGSIEPWPCSDNIYRRLPEYPHKIGNNQNPTRNISPRQTFQENMPRIMVPPTYNTLKLHEESNFSQITDRNVSLSKNVKLNVQSETKYCDVPYTINPMSNEQKTTRNPDICVSSVHHPVLARMPHHGWPPSSVNLHASRSYGTPELYQYPEYPSCAGSRSVPMARPHRTIAEDPGHVYSDSYYQEANVRFKPYPNVKERYPQTRYEYFSNYSNPFHPSPFTQNKYEIPKTMHPHSYPTYPHLKYLDKRMVDPIMEGYQRQTTPQSNYNMPFRNQIIHHNYGPVIGNCSQNKIHPFPTDTSAKSIGANKLPYENSNKIYIDYGNAQTKPYQPPDNHFVNEMTRVNPMKNQVLMPNYQPISTHTIPPHPFYKRDNPQMKSYDYKHLRNPSINIINPITQFSPMAIAISPTESNTSNDTIQTQSNSQEDCGYVSQSSSTSIRSMESANNRLANDYYRRYYDFRYGHVARSSPILSRSEMNVNSNISLKDKKQINLRQFIQMWNEGDEENGDNNIPTKEISVKAGSNDANFPKQHETITPQEQLYVLGLVNVSSEELSKYEHIQTVSKLPENIKGYNNIELLNQFEEVTESSNISYYKPLTPREFQPSLKGTISKQLAESIPRPVSPLDVEAKISQSVIHKEVGCNFEIKPCSPKMLNVEIASPIQNILTERVIEKVTNPFSTMIQSPSMSHGDENRDTCNVLKRQGHLLSVNENSKISSCKMVKTQFSSNRIESEKTNYSLQDLESSSGVCLASLPRLDNDIELSFPEVNQQFINANKRESAMPTTYLKDFQEIIDQSDRNISQHKDALPQETISSNQLSPIIESDKEFTKLSKYRKIKLNGPEPNDNISQTKTVRTDSVIIKNPENAKNYEENMELVPMNNFTDDTQQVPMNLTSQCNFRLENLFESNMKNRDSLDDATKCPAVDVAIDFSLNKTDSNVPDPNFDKTVINITKEMPVRDENHLEEPTNMPKKYQHSGVVDSMSAEPNSPSAIQSVIGVARCENNDLKLEIEAQNNFLCKEAVNEGVLDAITNSEHTNNSLMKINNEDKKVNKEEDKKYNLITAPNIYDSLDKSKAAQTNSLANKKNTSKIATSSALTISLNDKESMPKIESCYNEALMSPMEHVNDTHVKSNSEIDILESEIIFDSMSEQILLSEDTFPEKPLLREASKIQLDHKINQNSFKVNVENDQISYEHSTRNTNELFCHNLCLKNCKESLQQTSKLLKKYFSKELFSPWIQKLLMYDDEKYSKYQNNIITCKTTAYKIVNIPLTDSFAADSCNDHVKGVINVKEEKDSKRELQLERKKIDLKYSHECLENISTEVENSSSEICIDELQPKISDMANNSAKETNIKDLQPELIENKFDRNSSSNDNIAITVDNSSEGTIIDKMQPEIMKDKCGDSCIDKVNNCREGTSVEVLRPQTIKGTMNRNPQCTHIIINTADNSEKEISLEEIQQEITTTKSAQPNLELINNISDTMVISTGVTSKEELPEIANGEFDNNRKCIHNNIIEIDNSKETIKDDSQTNVKVECYDNGRNMVNEIRQETSIDKLRPEVSNSEFGHNRDCVDNITDIVDNSRNKVTIENLHTEIVQCEFNHNSNLCRNNINDIVHNRRKGTNIEFTNTDSKYNHENENGNETKTAKNDNASISESKQTITEIQFDHNREYIDKITKMSDNAKEKSIIDELQLNITKSECNQYRDYINNITKIPANDNDIGELQPKINKVECDEYHECISNISNIPDLNKEEIDIGEMQPIVTKIKCNYNREFIDSIMPKANGDKEETNIDEFQIKLTTIESGHICKKDVISLENLNSKIMDEFDKSDPKDILTNIRTYKNKLQGKNDLNINTVEENTIFNSICENNKEICCTPNQEIIKHIHSDITTDEEIINLSEIGDTPKTFVSLPKISEEHDIIKPDIDDKINLHHGDPNLENKPSESRLSEKRRLTLKRSFSDSALNSYNNDDNLKRNVDDISFMWPVKRKKNNEIENIEPDVITEDLHNIIQNNRRNSISSVYNEENVSFCILIDNNCIITAENEDEKICYTELSENCIAEIHSTNNEECTEHIPNIVSGPLEYNYSDSFIIECDEEKAFEESWVEDVACVETVVTDEIAEDIIISAPASPKDIDLSDNNESGFFSGSISEHTDKVKYIYGGKMCSDDVNFLETLYKTPQMDVNKTLTNRECQVSDKSDKYYDKESLEKILSESNANECIMYNTLSYAVSRLSSDTLKLTASDENEHLEIITALQTESNYHNISTDTESKKMKQNNIQFDILNNKTQDDTVHSYESSIDDVFTYEKEDEVGNFTISSSPEVSSTTSEEKSAILLKITNYKGSRMSQINDTNSGNSSSCKYTEQKDYSQSNFPSRPLITKAAKKYIPPLKESIPDLKVKLSLPQQSLMKLKQLKISKAKPKVNKHNALVPIIPKKPKPKFEDVLKSIDEIQFKMHKEKSRKTKIIPKVVIKKNRNGSHYASTSNKDTFNPDLTGRKWQPWVFIEKNHFIDKMAIKNKTKAVYNHRKNTYVLAEKFRKYKSVNHSKFIISQPKLDSSSKGHLKYTIRLRHY